MAAAVAPAPASPAGPSPRPPRQISALVFALVMVSCAYFVHGAGHNQNSRFDLTRALVEDGTVRIDRFRDNTHDISKFEGHWYSDKAPGLALIATVPYALGLRHAQPADTSEPDPWVLHGLTLVTCSLATALAAVALLRLLAGLGVGLGPSLLAVIGWVLGTNAFAYAGLFLSHQLVASLVVLALAGVRAAELAASSLPAPAPARRGLALAFGAGFAAGGAVLSEFPAVLLAAAIGVYALRALGVRGALAFAAGGIVPAVVLAAYNAACFGDPFHLGYQSLANAHFAEGVGGGLLGFHAPSLGVMAELTLFEFRGLLPLSPFLVLAVPGLWWMARAPALRRLGALCAVSLLGLIVLMSGFPFWNGGAAMGPRHLVPVLPFAIVAVAVSIDRVIAVLPRAGTAAIVAVIAVSIAICTASVAVAPEFFDVQARQAPVPGMDIPRREHPVRDVVFPLLARGHVSFKATQRGGLTYESWLPGHGRDAFNLGEVIGLSGKASLLPLLAAWLGLGIAIARQYRIARTSGGGASGGGAR
jgi:hypothetical protein